MRPRQAADGSWAHAVYGMSCQLGSSSPGDPPAGFSSALSCPDGSYLAVLTCDMEVSTCPTQQSTEPSQLYLANDYQCGRFFCLFHISDMEVGHHLSCSTTVCSFWWENRSRFDSAHQSDELQPCWFPQLLLITLRSLVVHEPRNCSFSGCYLRHNHELALYWCVCVCVVCVSE